MEQDSLVVENTPSATARELIDRLRTLDVRLWVESDRLRVSAPAGTLTPRIKDELKERKDELTEFLRLHPEAAEKPQAPADRSLLSFSQQRLWFLDRMDPGNPVYNIWGLAWVEGTLDVAAMEKAFAELIRRHETLRTSFASQEGEPVCRVGTGEGWKLRTLDLAHLGPEAARTEALRLAREEGRSPFDLGQGPLFRALLVRCSPGVHALMTAIHHIVSDGVSFAVMTAEFEALYLAFTEGRPSPLPELTLQYSDFSRWQRENWKQGGLESQLGYWKEKLSGRLPILELPADRPRPPVQSIRGNQLSIDISRELTDKLRLLSRQEKSTLFMTLLAAFKVLLARYTGSEDILVGSPVSGRPRPELEPLIGFFVNNLVLRTDVSGNPSFRELLARVRKTSLEAYANQDVPFDHLVDVLRPERNASHSPLFQVMFTLQPQGARNLQVGAVAFRPADDLEPGTSRFDLAVDVVERGGGLRVFFEYSLDLFDEATIRQLQSHYERLLQSVAASPERGVAELPLLAGGEREKILLKWNETAADIPDVCVHHLVAAQAGKTPGRIAVEFGDLQWTYAELNECADRLAARLQKLGIGPGMLVGVCLERSPLMVAAVLATLKAGGAYVPLDPAFPKDRLEFMVRDGKLALLLTQEHLKELLPQGETRMLCLDAADAGGDSPAVMPVDRSAPDDLMYVIYTSGSTGMPKGVEITHRSVVNFLESMAKQPGLTEKDRLVSLTTLSFDIAGLELYLPLITGATIVLASRSVAIDAARLIDLIEHSRASVVQATPATWKMLLDAGWSGKADLKILCGGESLSEELAARLLNCCASLWNMYGPTETTIWSTLDKVTDPGEITIGTPIANTRVHILDAHLQPVPVGVIGELVIGGAGLARGYLNREELTREKFIPDPLTGEPGERLYRTGDLARYRADGRIECLGRVDHQVKIRGFRIELGEIETALGRMPGIGQAVVMAREDGGDKKLVAYYIADETAAVSASAARDHLRGMLPEYMVPSVFIRMDEFPLTPNKKIDRKALPAVSSDRVERRSFVAPRTATEQAVADVWKEVLSTAHVGLEDNFFDLGGHSLLLVKAQSRLASRLGCELTVLDMFQRPTVAGLAELLDRKMEGTSNPRNAEGGSGTR